jgi:hypothetical protein
MSPITNENGGNKVCNKMSSGVVCVTKLDLNGLPSEPPEARKAFKHTFRFQVRDNVPITIKDWRQVPAVIKDKIWSNMKKKNQVSNWCRGRCEEYDVY